MTSIVYRLAEKGLLLTGFKKMMSLEGKAFDSMAASMSAKQNIKPPKPRLQKRVQFGERMIAGSRCFTFAPKGGVPREAVLYLYGGGCFMPPGKRDFLLAAEISSRTETEVWLPAYPLAPQFTYFDSTAAVIGTYASMLERYGSDSVAFLGFSSGGALALSACMMIKSGHPAIPFPACMVLVSPGAQLPPSAGQLAEMEKLSPLDTLLAPSFFKNYAFLGLKREDEWLYSPALADLSGFPPIDLYYGTHEIMYAYLPDLHAALKKAKVKHRLHIGEGLCHCWPLLGFTREAKAARREICGILTDRFGKTRKQA